MKLERPGDAGTDTAVIVGADGTSQQVLPDDFQDADLLVVCLDQGSIGAAGMAFAINQLGLTMSCRFDKFHRIIRDIKLSLKHCCDGIFCKAQLYSAYLYGLNYKPFGKGGFAEVKNRLLVVFLATENVHSEIWLKYCHRIASDLAVPCVTSEHHDALWEAVAALPSFHQKLGFPKMGRWFSWNDSCHAQMPEFYATKMLLEHHLDNVEDPDLADVNTFDIDRAALAAAGKTPTPAAELAALKVSLGGWRWHTNSCPRRSTEQTEFPDVCRALMQKRQRERVAEWRMMRGLEVPRRGRKRPKAGAKREACARGAAVPRAKRRRVRGAAGAQPLGDGGPDADAPAADDIPPVADGSEEPEAPVVGEPEPVALEPELPAAVAPGPEVPALPPPLAAVVAAVDIVAEDDGRPGVRPRRPGQRAWLVAFMLASI